MSDFELFILDGSWLVEEIFDGPEENVVDEDNIMLVECDDGTFDCIFEIIVDDSEFVHMISLESGYQLVREILSPHYLDHSFEGYNF